MTVSARLSILSALAPELRLARLEYLLEKFEEFVRDDLGYVRCESCDRYSEVGYMSLSKSEDQSLCYDCKHAEDEQ